jgi:hypothetical protein
VVPSAVHWNCDPILICGRNATPACNPVPVADDYFNDTMLNRQRLLWTVATRRQLERWEPMVAAWVLESLGGPPFSGADIWAAEIEHHFTLIAARNLMRALELSPPSSVPVDATLRSELIEGRDLNEHWPDNMPVFNITPRPAQPKYRSGKDFAKRNPKSGPYDWLSWSNKTGARLLPNVTAQALHEVLEAVEAEVLAADATLSEYVPPPAPSPWHYENCEWWPKPAHADTSN